MKNAIFYLLFILLAVACTPQRRFNRLIEKHPELLTMDSIVLRDTLTIEIPAVEFDTIFANTISTDTVIVEKDGVKVKYYNNGKTVYLAGERAGETITKVIERKIPVYIRDKPQKWYEMSNFARFLIFLALFTGMFIMYCIVRIVTKPNKNQKQK